MSGLPRVFVVLLSAAALVVVMAGIHLAATIVGPVLLALILTVTVYPMGASMRRRGLPRWAAASVLVVSSYLIVVGLALCTVLALGELGDVVPKYSQQLDETVAAVRSWLDAHGLGTAPETGTVAPPTSGWVTSIVSSVVGGIAGLVGNLVLLGSLLLFMGIDADGMARALSGLRTRRPLMVDAWREFARRTRTYLTVATVFGLLVAAVDTVALLLMQIPGAFAWGVLAFVTNFIPNVGFVIGMVPPALIALLEGGPGLMLGVILVYCIANLVLQSVIQPKVVGDAVGLTPSLTFMSLMFWAWLVGALGALLAVPLTLLLKAVLVDADANARWTLPLLSGKPPAPVEASPGLDSTARR